MPERDARGECLGELVTKVSGLPGAQMESLSGYLEGDTFVGGGGSGVGTVFIRAGFLDQERADSGSLIRRFSRSVKKRVGGVS